ncbi:MAG: helix-turn-helix domain-containing protein [Sedimentibacter sp.]
MSLGDRIKECRQSRKLSQEKLAEIIGVSRQAVTKWETNLTAPSTENLFKLAEIFGTTVDMLIGPDESEKKSSAEQIYYLYRMEEAKKAEELCIKRKKNIRIAIIIAAGYLAIFLAGWIISGGLGQSKHLFDWLVRHYLFLIATVVSVVPALFGKYRFSMVTLAAFLFGLILGELLGKNIPGAKYEMGPYGWRIWSAFFFILGVIGVIWEQFVKHNLSLRSKKVWLWSIATFVSAVILVVFVFNAIPKYPQPEYTVNSYAELIEVFSDDPQYLFPSEDILPSKQGGYTVYLKSRFSHEKTGYIMSFKAREGEYDVYTISCRLTSSLHDSESQIQPNSEYNGIDLSVTDTHICFELNNCRYDIHFTGATKIFSEKALLIAQTIIDKSILEM